MIDVTHLVKDVAKFVKGTFPPSIQIETQVARRLHSVKGNATQLHQVLMNLCVKVVCASGAGSRQKLAEVESLGVHGFLNKPYTILALLSAVNTVLRSG